MPAREGSPSRIFLPLLAYISVPTLVLNDPFPRKRNFEKLASSWRPRDLLRKALIRILPVGVV
jgi:hypothetical protein